MKLMIAVGLGLLGLMVLVTALRALALPARYAATLAVRAVLGYGLLAGLNLLGAGWGLHLPANPVTGAVIGVLGVPGGLMLYLLSRIWQV